MRKTIYLLIFSLVMITSCGGEADGTKSITGDYTCTSLKSDDIEVPHPEALHLNLKEEGKFTSVGFENIEPEFKADGDWKLNDDKTLLTLSGMDFELKETTDSTLKLHVISHEVGFTIQLKK